MKDRDFSEVLDKYIDQEKLHNFEGRRGVEALCKLASAIGYDDPMNFGQFAPNLSIGNLIEMLKDNPGLIENMVNWIRDSDVDEWKESVESGLYEDDDIDEETPPK